MTFEEPVREALNYLRSRLPLVEIIADDESMEDRTGEERKKMKGKYLMNWHVPKTEQEVKQYAQFDEIAKMYVGHWYKKR